VDGGNAGFLATMRGLLKRTFSKEETNTFAGVWRHPAKGTGQICDAMAQGIRDGGGRLVFESKLLAMAAEGGRVKSVTAEIGGEQIVFEAANVVSSIPLEFLAKLLLPKYAGAASSPKALETKRTVVLVYLFFNEEPRFPQAWLQVTCPQTRIGRIANYTAFNGDMVPKGQTCLCSEFYCFGEDPMLAMTDDQIVELVLGYLNDKKLVSREKCFDRRVLRLPGADASQNRDNWMSKERVQLLAEFAGFKNLYYVNRTETDLATLAGIEAGEAILSGDRTEFDLHVNPASLPIRSVEKAFRFT
jgi:protoporphyrinogen oxidase